MSDWGDDDPAYKRIEMDFPKVDLGSNDDTLKQRKDSWGDTDKNNRKDDYGSKRGFGGGRDRDDKGGYGGRNRRNNDDGDKGGYGGRNRSYNDDGDKGGYGGRNEDDYKNEERDDKGGYGGRNRRNNDDGEGGGFGGRNRRNNDDGDGDDGRREKGGFGGRPRRNEDGDAADGGGRDDNMDKPRELYVPPEPTDNEDEIFGSGISSGINFEKYDEIPIEITGVNAPEQITSFEDSGLRKLLLDNIIKSTYKKPTPIQKVAIPAIMAGRDIMGCAQTGSGKTAAFLLPMINKMIAENANMLIGKPHALILSPTRELAIQIHSEARKFAHGSSIKVCIIYGGTATGHQSEVLNRGCHILVATPGRLKDFVNRGYIQFDETRFVVLDEADRMLDMGFRGDIETVMRHPTMREKAERQTLMFSATFAQDVQELAKQYLSDHIFIAVGIVGGACTDVQQEFIEVSKVGKRDKLLEILENGDANGTLVFVQTRRGADFLAAILSQTEIPTTSIHGDRLQSQREQALNDFKTGRMKVLIATSVAARGLDIKNVRHVINYDLPDSVDEYVHRIGRTGRVGNKGRATSFFDSEYDSSVAPQLVNMLEQANIKVPEFLAQYKGGSGGGGSGDFGGYDTRKVVANNAAPVVEDDW